MRVRTEAEKSRKGSTGVNAAKRRRKEGHGTPEFGFMNHGGRRKGAGRKAAKTPDGKREHSSHAVREHFTASRPLHVTVRVRAGLPSLRGAVLSSVVLKALEAGNEREGFRLVHFSVQSNHLHLICEAEAPAALAAAMKGLNGRIAKAINQELGLKGGVSEGRYHLEVLDSPTRVRNVVRYVLRNGEKHGAHVGVRHGDVRPCPDPLSSAAWYGYWKESELNVLATQSAATIVRPAQCYLLREGLRRAERLSLLDAPPEESKAARRKARKEPSARPDGLAGCGEAESAGAVPYATCAREAACAGWAGGVLAGRGADLLALFHELAEEERALLLNGMQPASERRTKEMASGDW